MSRWSDKEESYGDRRRRSTDLWKYIPKKLYDAVADTGVDDDGYWVYLNRGWLAYDHGSDCSIIHEYNVADLKEAIKTIGRSKS